MHTFKAMNTTFQTWLLGKDDQAKVEHWVRFVEEKLSRFRAESELSQMNRANGKPFMMSPLLFEVMSESIKYYKSTDGIFNPFMGKVIAGLGYRNSFETLESGASFDFTDAWSTLDHPYTLDRFMKSITLEAGVHVDLGGIAKAWCAQYMAKQLQKKGVTRGAINAGGDLLCWGEHDSKWNISIAHPLHKEQNLVTVQSNYGFGIATSSRVKRSWTDQHGHMHHHLIDPRTQESSTMDLLQVSVIASDLTLAEVYTKCILILGSEKGIPWFESTHPECVVVAVTQDLTILTAGDFSKYTLERNDSHE